VHRAFDTRIFHKECKTLAMAGYDVTLIAPHAEGDLTQDGVKLRAVRPPRNRRERILSTVGAVYRAAVRENAEIYHFHDPELMPVGGLLKLRGKRVIYDVHEDYAGTMRGKMWLPSVFQNVAAMAVSAGEAAFSAACDSVIAATPTIASKFRARKTQLVQNFPWKNELRRSDASPYETREPIAVYVGALADQRGLREMRDAVKMAALEVPVRLVTAGAVIAGASAELEDDRENGLVEHLGMLNRPQVAQLLARAKIGMVLLHPTGNYINAQPVKLFEYMSVGLPVIASDFPLWRRIVKSSGCGLLVDPLDPAAIAGAMVWLLRHPAQAAEMGRNGERAVAETYNWERESERLISAYAHLETSGRS
jgi:glycosyltransferase involved in cell wall biosynthesis